MTIRRVTSPDVPEPPPERWSNCLVSDGIAYVAGMTARGTDAATGQDGRVRAGQADLRQDQEHGRGRRRHDGRRGQGHIYVTNIKNNTKVWGARASSSPATSRPRRWSGRGARRAGDPGRDRGGRPYRQGRALALLELTPTRLISASPYGRPLRRSICAASEILRAVDHDLRAVAAERVAKRLILQRVGQGRVHALDDLAAACRRARPAPARRRGRSRWASPRAASAPRASPWSAWRWSTASARRLPCWAGRKAVGMVGKATWIWLPISASTMSGAPL